MATIPEDFYRPTPDVTFYLLKVSGHLPEADGDLPSRHRQQELPEPLLETAREDIALRLWGGLAGLARAHTVAHGEERCSLRIDEALPELSVSLCRRLGLPGNERAMAVVTEDLLGGFGGFFHWLRYERGGEYPAAWGVMHFDGSTLSFSDVHVPRFLAGEYRKAESMRGGLLAHAD